MYPALAGMDSALVSFESASLGCLDNTHARMEEGHAENDHGHTLELITSS